MNISVVKSMAFLSLESPFIAGLITVILVGLASCASTPTHQHSLNLMRRGGSTMHTIPLGHEVDITLKSGAQISGILKGISEDQKLTISSRFRGSLQLSLHQIQKLDSKRPRRFDRNLSTAVWVSLVSGIAGSTLGCAHRGHCSSTERFVSSVLLAGMQLPPLSLFGWILSKGSRTELELGSARWQAGVFDADGQPVKAAAARWVVGDETDGSNASKD